MMVALGTIIAAQFPDADPRNDYRIEDHSDGEGPFIAHWDEEKLGPVPTPKQIDKWQEEYDPAKATGRLRAEVLEADPAHRDFVAKLRNSTADELAAFVETEVTDLAAAKALIAKMMLVLAIKM